MVGAEIPSNSRDGLRSRGISCDAQLLLYRNDFTSVLLIQTPLLDTCGLVAVRTLSLRGGASFDAFHATRVFAHGRETGEGSPRAENPPSCRG